MLFESSKPVAGKFFFDREQELNELLLTVPRLKKGAATYIALLGHRKLGKTSLLEKFIEKAEKDNVYTAKIDCWEKENLSLEFLQNYLTNTINAVLTKISFKRKLASLDECLLNQDELINLLAEIKKMKIKSVEIGLQALLAIKEGKISGPVISEIIDLPEKIAQEFKSQFWIIIDEFQELKELNKFKAVKNNIGNVFSFLRSRWQNHKRVNYFVAGSKITMMKEILLKKNSPFYQHFKILEISPFKDREAFKMLKTISSAIKKKIPEEIIHKIIKVIGGNPFYLQIVGEELCRKEKINEDSLKVTIQEVLFNESGRLYLYFEDLFSKVVGGSASCENTLIAIANKEGTLTEKAKELGVSAGAVKTWLKRVSDLVERNNNIYRIKDPSLELWLKNRSGQRKILPPLILGSEAEKIAARDLSSMGFQLIYQSQASRGAFDLLGIIGIKKAGIQVKSGSFPFYIKKSEIEEMKFWAKELSWFPIIAVVFQGKSYFYSLKNLSLKGKHYRIDERTKEISNLLSIIQ